MKKFITALTLSVLVIGSVTAQSSGNPGSADLVAKVKRYADSKKKVTVTPSSGEQVKGYISAYDQDKFTITDSKSGAASTFRYTEVSRVRKTNSLTTGGIVALAAAGAGTAVLLGFLLARCRNEGGC